MGVPLKGPVFVGAASLMDPQTGHYTTELPIAPEMLTEPAVYTGADNAFMDLTALPAPLLTNGLKLKREGL